MKVQSTQNFQDLLKQLDRVNPKDSTEKFSDGSSSQQQNKQKKKDQETTVEVTDEAVDQAIQSFTADTQATAMGIKASSQGSGPGLKILLKDQSGKTIRQLSGEEFLKLRETVAKIGGARGKILDQKA